MRLARSIAYAGAAILAISLVWHEHAAPSAANTPALFDSDPRHVSNRLYRALHVRTVPDGKQYGFDTLDPLLWSETNHLLEGISHQQAIALANEFLRTHAERQITDPLKRAILQRDLWAVLDWADQPDQPELYRASIRTPRINLSARSHRPQPRAFTRRTRGAARHLRPRAPAPRISRGLRLRKPQSSLSPA